MQPAHYPRQVPLSAYGNGGFRFAGMSHQGSVLCLPDGIYGWPVAGVDDLQKQDHYPRILAGASEIELFLIGTGKTHAALDPAICELLSAHGLRFDVMTTAAAVRTYNVLAGDGRPVGAGLLAVARPS